MITMNERTKKFMVGGVALAGAAVAAPVIWAGVSGLIGLVTAATIAGVSITVAPVLAGFLANMKLKGVKLVAAANPIEELQNDYLRQEAALKEFAKQITDAATEAHLFDTKMANLAKQYPTEAAQFKAQSDGMHQLITIRKQHYEKVKQDLAEYEAEIKKASAVYDMALASERLNKAAGKLGADPIAKIRKETAIDSIQRKVSRSFAELQQAMLEEAPAKPVPPSTTTAYAPAPTPVAAPAALAHNPQPTLPLASTTPGRRATPLSKRA